jgi:hypothetical protein
MQNRELLSFLAQQRSSELEAERPRSRPRNRKRRLVNNEKRLRGG